MVESRDKRWWTSLRNIFRKIRWYRRRVGKWIAQATDFAKSRSGFTGCWKDLHVPLWPLKCVDKFFNVLVHKVRADVERQRDSSVTLAFIGREIFF